MTPDDLEALTRRPTTGPFRATTLDTDGTPHDTLADLPPARDGLLFVGLQPARESVAAGHYGQDRVGQTSWRRLMLAGILPAGTAIATADEALVAAGHGITDLRKVPADPDRAEPSADALRAGVGALWQKIALWRPAAVVFLDRKAAVAAAGRDVAEPWGHLAGVALGGRPCFLLPGMTATTEQVEESTNFLRNLAASLPVDRP